MGISSVSQLLFQQERELRFSFVHLLNVSSKSDLKISGNQIHVGSFYPTDKSLFFRTLLHGFSLKIHIKYFYLSSKS